MTISPSITFGYFLSSYVETPFATYAVAASPNRPASAFTTARKRRHATCPVPSLPSPDLASVTTPQPTKSWVTHHVPLASR